MNILYQFNEKYVPYAGVSMTSLLENNRTVDEIYIFVLGENLEDESVEKFKLLARKYADNTGKIRQVYFLDSSKLVEKMKLLNMPTYRGSYAANMRLFVSDIVDEMHKAKGQGFIEARKGYSGDGSKSLEDRRLLYLDADTIITDSLEGIYRYTIKTLGMVYDTLGCQHKYEIGLDREDGYYNSGVILYDLDRWEEERFTERIVEHVRSVRAQYPSPDQDLINVVVRNEISPLPVECNYQPHLRYYSYITFMKAFKPYPFYSGGEITRANARPVILHAFRYVGEFCWHKGNLHPFNREFDKYLRISPWKDYNKEPSAGGIALGIEKMLYRILPKRLFIEVFTRAHRAFYDNANKKSEKNVISKRM